METLDSGLPKAVGEKEDIVRFAFSSREIKGNVIKPNLFLPNPKDAEKETSVFRHGREPLQALATIAKEVEEKRGRKMVGAAVVAAGVVFRAGLDCVGCEPPPRHAGIRGWPWFENNREVEKSKQLEKATILAAAAGDPVFFES